MSDVRDALKVIAKDQKIKTFSEKLVKASGVDTLDEAIIIAPLIPYRHEMINRLNRKGISTPSTISHVDLATRYFNTFVTDKPLPDNWYSESESFDGIDSFQLKKNVLKNVGRGIANSVIVPTKVGVKAGMSGLDGLKSGGITGAIRGVGVGVMNTSVDSIRKEKEMRASDQKGSFMKNISSNISSPTISVNDKMLTLKDTKPVAKLALQPLTDSATIAETSKIADVTNNVTQSVKENWYWYLGGALVLAFIIMKDKK